MKIAYFPNQTALRSTPIWQAFLDGCLNLGMTPIEGSTSADCAVIWSVLWQGRMRQNQQIYQTYRSRNKPVFIIEVGTLDRGRTWKISANNITRYGIYGNEKNLDKNRENFLGIHLHPENNQRNNEILIVGQHEKSLQWENQPPMRSWFEYKIKELRKYTHKNIVVRPHPRNFMKIPENFDVKLEFPEKIPNTYDHFDITYGHHCTINHNSGPGIQSAIHGTPIICDHSSLAWEISSKIEEIDFCKLPDRTHWFQKILHTEWLVDEIGQGIPQKRILESLNG